ncbi:MAG: TIGR00645 family protein [bacterium]
MSDKYEPEKTAEPPMRIGPLERMLEGGLFASRWLLLPFYAGLVLSLIALLVQFGRELIHLLTDMTTLTEAETTILVLSLIDVVLTANLVLMVVLSGYENSISKLDLKGSDRPSWLGKLDASGLKQKVFGSIVAISAIQLLRVFMQVDKAADRDLWWSSGIHMVFVVSAVLLSLSDRISAGAKKG